MDALLIEWNTKTGIRAGNINMHDPKLQCYGWQNFDVTPAIELRVIEDNRDITQYQNILGVKIIKGNTAINDAIDDNFPPKYMIDDEIIYAEHLKQLNKSDSTKINITDLPDNKEERLKTLKNTYKIKGIKKIERNKI